MKFAPGSMSIPSGSGNAARLSALSVAATRIPCRPIDSFAICAVPDASTFAAFTENSAFKREFFVSFFSVHAIGPRPSTPIDSAAAGTNRVISEGSMPCNEIVPERPSCATSSKRCGMAAKDCTMRALEPSTEAERSRLPSAFAEGIFAMSAIFVTAVCVEALCRISEPPTSTRTVPLDTMESNAGSTASSLTCTLMVAPRGPTCTASFESAASIDGSIAPLQSRLMCAARIDARSRSALEVNRNCPPTPSVASSVLIAEIVSTPACFDTRAVHTCTPTLVALASPVIDAGTVRFIGRVSSN